MTYAVADRTQSASSVFDGRVLIVDDQPVNIVLLERMLRREGYRNITSTTQPAEVADLHRANDYDLIILDLQMPGTDGFMVMEMLADVEPEGSAPVLVITAQPAHKLRALQAGAKDFIGKPFEQAEVLVRVRNMLEVRLLNRKLQDYSGALERDVEQRTAELHQSYLETLLTMTRAAEYKDEQIGSHITRISHYCAAMADFLGESDAFIDSIFLASPMHDIGKIGIPDQVLLKPGSLNADEWTIMKGHASIGWTILGDSQSPYVQLGAQIALHHHERWNGGGYPNAEHGEDIPRAARIMSICDIYDALRSKRPYKPAFDHERAVKIITRGDGRTEPGHFDPEVLAAFEVNTDLFRDIYEAHAG